MPNVSLSVYLQDDDYVKYLKDKEGFNTIARESMKKAINKQK
jgi:hypothetical protein